MTLRVAGGWVRDRLLNRENHDIDIAVEGMTGSDFARVLHEELQNMINSGEILPNLSNVH